MTIRDSSDSERLERIERIVEGIARDQVAMKADISSMKDDISVVKSDVVDLKADVAVLKSDVAGLKSDVAVLKSDVAVLKSDVAVLKADVAVLKADVAVLKIDVAGLKADVTVLKSDVAGLKTDVAVLKSDVAGLKSDVAMLKAEMSVVKADVAVLKSEMSVVKGWQTELAVERRARDVFRRLCRGHLLRFYPDEELHHYVRELTNTGAITRDDASRAESIDFLLEGTDAEGVAVMYAVEVSYTVGVGDCERAIDKAALLTRMLRREVKPAVVGEVFTAGFAQAADMQSVAFIHMRTGNEIVR